MPKKTASETETGVGALGTQAPSGGAWPQLHGEHETRESRAERGKAARVTVPRTSQGAWAPQPDRHDPVQLLIDQTSTRLPSLVPVRNGRMLNSPFAFYRGAAALMAADLAPLPTSGIEVQLCGDAHLSNFGGYAAPDRKLVFDLNDFDETLPGPWEWDVKRLMTSLQIAGRDRQFDDVERDVIVRSAAAAYRQAIQEYSELGNQQLWYSRMTIDDIRTRWSALASKKAAQKFEKMVTKAMSKDSVKASAKLTRVVDGRPRILSDPPLMVPISELLSEEEQIKFEGVVRAAFRSYRSSLSVGRRRLIEQFHFVDVARRVSGVGSVGTRGWVVLMLGVDSDEPLFLQLKEAGDSVLEQYLGKSEFKNHGQRVVAGQQRMQASSDIFLGWSRVSSLEGGSRDFFIRQLWDWKVSADVESQSQQTMEVYGQMCAQTLARAHARSGDRVAIAGYLGRSGVFDEAMVEFAKAYADQNDHDYAAFAQAEREGRITAERGI